MNYLKIYQKAPIKVTILNPSLFHLVMIRTTRMNIFQNKSLTNRKAERNHNRLPEVSNHPSPRRRQVPSPHRLTSKRGKTVPKISPCQSLQSSVARLNRKLKENRETRLCCSNRNNSSAYPMTYTHKNIVYMEASIKIGLHTSK